MDHCPLQPKASFASSPHSRNQLQLFSCRPPYAVDPTPPLWTDGCGSRQPSAAWHASHPGLPTTASSSSADPAHFLPQDSSFTLEQCLCEPDLSSALSTRESHAYKRRGTANGVSHRIVRWADNVLRGSFHEKDTIHSFWPIEEQ
ncbi:hypothetical protein VDGE_30462 [Verticillium dahliae]|uniref:Uncharacterized protein n=1 Tax=Verticillium dahliae TaxID=27337 RepID=A0A444RXV1_VERDA|nr:hypothetical protein VDGE_30462 [Verticillium dahliae]